MSFQPTGRQFPLALFSWRERVFIDLLYRGERLHESDGLALSLPQKLAFPHHALSTDDRALGPALDLAAVIGRPAGPALHPAIGDGPAALQIDDGEVGVIALGDAALAGEPENAAGPMTRQVDEALERQAALVHMVEHDRHQGLDSGHARG